MSDIRAWYAANMLKCNDPKTDMMVISSKFLPINDTLPVKVGDVSISAATKIRNLGVIMDNHLSMTPHISNVVRNAFLKIREISYYRKFLTPSATKTLIHAYVTSRLDYCSLWLLSHRDCNDQLWVLPFWLSGFGGSHACNKPKSHSPLRVDKIYIVHSQAGG